MCCLSALYFKYIVPDNQFAKFNKLELRYLGESLQFLRNNAHNTKEVEPVIAVCMLLVHYGVCSTDNISQWSMHAQLLCFLQKKRISIDFPEALFIVYQIILTFIRPLDQSANHGVSIDYLLNDEPDLISDLGPSKRILWFIGRTAEVVSTTSHCLHERVNQGMILESSIREAVLRTEEVANRALVLEIGQCYKIAALLIVKCRLFG
jgi:hypothetical protein